MEKKLVKIGKIYSYHHLQLCFQKNITRVTNCILYIKLSTFLYYTFMHREKKKKKKREKYLTMQPSSIREERTYK